MTPTRFYSQYAASVCETEEFRRFCGEDQVGAGGHQGKTIREPLETRVSLMFMLIRVVPHLLQM